MKRTALSALALLLTASLANAQPPGAPGPGGEFRPPHPFLLVFDADQSGDLSAEEIKAASEALAKLDKNTDGKVEESELPALPRGGRGPGQGGPGQGGRGNFDLAAQFTEWDKDGDGKIAKEDMPERMQRMFERFDADKDMFVSKKEIDDAMAAFRERFQQGRGQRGQGGRRGADDGDNGDRPERRARPESADPDA